MRATTLLGKTLMLSFVLAGGLAAQAAAPKDATGQCTDGSYTTAKTQERGCLKHGGVKTWYGSGATAATGATTTSSHGATAPAAAPAAEASTARSPKAAPKDATGQCTDGSYTTAKTKERGCLKHGGVKTWYGATPVSASSAAAGRSARPRGTAPAPGGTTVAKTTAAAPAQAPSNPTDVWVNLSTKAYHCPGTKWYGTTKHGKYMSEADAKAAGFHPSYGKSCSS